MITYKKGRPLQAASFVIITINSLAESMKSIINKSLTQASNIVHIKRICADCKIPFKPSAPRRTKCVKCVCMDFQYLEYVAMARGIGHSYVGDICR